MKKLLAALLTLGVLLGVSWALAEDGGVSLAVTNATVTDGTVSGNYYYRVTITLPEGSDGSFQMGWTGDPGASEPDGWEDVDLSYFEGGDHDRQGIMVATPAETDGRYSTDAVFVRLNENDEQVRKIVFEYDTQAVDSTLFTHVSSDASLALMTPVTLHWDAVAGAEMYLLKWTDPIGRERLFYTGDTSVTIDEQFYTNLPNVLGYAGDYTFWVLPMKDGKIGVLPDHFHAFTDTIVTDPDSRIRLTVNGSEQGGAVALQENLHFTAQMPGAAELRFFMGYELWDNLDFDRESGRWDGDWSASEESQVGRKYQFYALARFEGEENWVTSNIITCTVLGFDDADRLQGDLTWSLADGDTLPLDGLLQILVDPLDGAEYYACYLEKDGEWITDSGWFDAAAEGKTLVTLPLLDCEAGESYDLRVYAVKIGVPTKESEQNGTVRVTAPTSDGKILAAMKDTFRVHEPLRISLDYTERETLDQGWMTVTIYAEGDRNNRCYENSGWVRFQDFGCSIDTSGAYVLRAEVYTELEGQPEPMMLAEAEFPIRVLSDGALDQVRITGVSSMHRMGEAMHIGISQVQDAEWYDVMLHYCPEEEDWVELDSAFLDSGEFTGGQAQLTFDADRFTRPGRYRVWARASATGLDSSWDEKYFVITEITDESLVLTVNGESSLENYPANAEVRLKVSVPGAVAVRMLDEYGNWQPWDSRSFSEDGTFIWYSNWSGGTYTTVAQASYDTDPRYQDWDSFDWDGFDMNRDLTWTKGSNQVTMSFVSQGPAPEAVFTADETVERGKLLKVTITDATENGITADWFSANIFDAYGYYRKGIGTDRGTELPVTLTLPTGDLEGTCTLCVNACLDGYDWSESWMTIKVTEPEDPDVFTLDVQEDLVSERNFSISAYAPGASWIDLWVLDKENRVEYEFYGSFPGDYMDAMDQRWHGGEYDIYALAHYADENGNETREPRKSEVVTRTVRYLGQLDQPVIHLDSSLVQKADGVTFTVSGLDQGDWYDVRVRDVSAWDPQTGEELQIRRWTADDGAAPAKFTLAANELTAEHTYRIEAYAGMTGYEGSGADARFAVVDRMEVQLTLESENGTSDIENWPAEKALDFRLYAPDAWAVRFLQQDGSWFYMDGCAQDGGWFIFTHSPYRGEYKAVAQAAYDGYDFLHNDWDTFDWSTFDWEAQGFTWTATSNPIRVNVVSTGRLDPPKFTLEKNEVTRGEMVNVRITETQGKDERYDAWLRDDYGWDGEHFSWDADAKTISVATAEATPGIYKLVVWTGAEGMDGNETFLPVTIKEGPAGEIVFEISSDTVLLGNCVNTSIFARDAEHIGFSMDGGRWDLDENGNYMWDGCIDNWQDGENVRWYDPEDAGEHTLQAFAMFDGQWVAGPVKTVTVQVLGKVQLDLSGLPGTLTTGEAAELRFPLPEHADGMHIGLYEDWDDENGFHREVIHGNREYREDTVLTIPAANLNAGHRIVADLDSWGKPGYAGDGTSVDIPIIAVPSDAVTLKVDEGDYNPETGKVLANGDLRFRVTPAAGHTLTAVRFFDGYGYFDGGEPWTRDNHPDNFERDGSFVADRGGYNDIRTYSVFAEVQLDGGTEWVSSNVITFELEEKGEIGPYDFEDLSEITVARGEIVKLRFTEAENATRYWIDVFDENGNYNPETTCEGREVTLLTGSLPEGTYEILGRAGAEAGYLWRESERARRLTITEAQIPDSGIQITFSKNEVQSMEMFSLSIYAPGAERLRLCHMEPENIWWEEDGDSNTRNYILNGSGEQIFYIYAMRNGQWGEPVTGTINLICDGEAPAAKVTVTPDIVKPGEKITVRVELPEDAICFDIAAAIMRPDGEEWPEVLPYARYYASRDIIIDTANMAEDDTIVIWFETYAQGKESAWREYHAIVSSLKSLGQITFTTPAGLTTIGEEAFAGIGANAVRISDQVTTIGERAFAESSVRQIVIPRSVTSIADNAFEDNGAVVIFAPAGSYAEEWVRDHRDEQPVYFVQNGN